MRSPRLAEASKLLALATPISVTQLATMLLWTIDLLMVGHLGVVAMNAVSLGRLFVLGSSICAMGLIYGQDAIAAQAHGARDRQRLGGVLLHSCALAVVLSLPLALLDTMHSGQPLPWGDGGGWLLLALTGVFSFLGHVYFTRGYKHTSLQFGSVLALTVPVVAVFSGWWLLDEPLSPTFVVGGLLIVGASAWIGVRDGQHSRVSMSVEPAIDTARNVR